VVRVELDAASAPPLTPVVKAALHAAIDLPAADPGRFSEEAREVRFAIETARGEIAACLGLPASTITFTSSLAETAATVISSWRARRGGPVLVGAGERNSILATAAATGEVATIGLTSAGRIDLDHLRHLLAATTPALLCCQWVNQETGAIQPISEIADLARDAGVPLLVDGTAAGLLEPEPWMATAFYATDATGLGGPAGISMVAVPRGVRLTPLLLGGAQERNRRAGLEATILICGFGAAARERAEQRRTLAATLKRRRDELRAGIAPLGLTHVFGPSEDELRAPDVLCVEVPGIEAEAVVVGLDRRGVAAHSGSSCASETLEPSPVLHAMGVDAEHSLRISVSWATTAADVDRALSSIAATLDDLRSLRKNLS
jgi:cysteine desulfurase